MPVTERTQVLLSVEQRRRVEQAAAAAAISVGAVIRAAVDAFLPPTTAEQRNRGAEALLGLGAPVAEWSELAAEIERGYRG